MKYNKARRNRHSSFHPPVPSLSVQLTIVSSLRLSDPDNMRCCPSLFPSLTDGPLRPSSCCMRTVLAFPATKGIKTPSHRRCPFDESFSLAHRGGNIAAADRLAWYEAAEREVERKAHHYYSGARQHAWPDACRDGEPVQLNAKPPFLAGNCSSRREEDAFAKTDRYLSSPGNRRRTRPRKSQTTQLAKARRTKHRNH